MRLKEDYGRSSGILMPLTMLHGPFGIGVIGEEAREFIDFLSDCGFGAWQVLPVEHTGLGFSPYSCVSALAGEPNLIDPRALFKMGLVTQEELLERSAGTSDDSVHYSLVREKQQKLLRTAFSRLDGKPYADFKTFWFDNYALYLAIKRKYDDKAWFKWPDEALRCRDEAALIRVGEELSEEIEYNRFVQWLFHEEWRKLKDYATARGVSIIGDMPFYVSEDSAEVWARRYLFDADPEGNFPAVGGVPPDYFSKLGQRWGNPVFNWGVMKKEGYLWWKRRLKTAMERYDIVRLDHFRGFDTYWRIPSHLPDARGGKWVKGPGLQFFKEMQKALGPLPVIAEDLGDIGDGVRRLLKNTGFRGMRVLQFGFMGDGTHLPHGITENCVAYTGTHDNTTLLAWMYELSPEDREKALFYLGFEGDWTLGGPDCVINKAWIRALFMSRASLVVVPIQDMLGYGADTRTNIPGVPEGNWRFRIRADALGQIDKEFYLELNKAYGRKGEKRGKRREERGEVKAPG